MNSSRQHPKSLAREYALQFLYQCEIEKLFYFSEPHFAEFCRVMVVSGDIKKLVREIATQVFLKKTDIDATIEGAARNWRLERMAATDRATLRVAVSELVFGREPYKVIINEAVDLAKKYGTEHSGGFVNGLLDSIAKERAASTRMSS